MFKLYFQYPIICFILLSLSLPNNLKSQSYTFNPGKTYVFNIDTNTADFGGIEILNTGTQNLNLTWRHVLTDTLIDSRFELCNSGICFLNLPHSGIMPTIVPGDIGWIKFHMYSGIATGTNTIKYVVKNGAIQADTLTFNIIVSSATGLKETNDIKKVSMFPNPATNETSVSFNLTRSSEITIKVLNNSGQIIQQKISNLTAGLNNITIDTKNVAAGVYDVLIESKNGTITKKLSITK